MTAQDQQSRELLPCPFCGSTPQFSSAEWCDDNRYVSMSLECCVAMTASIGWRRARDMTSVEHRAELQKRLVDAWNTRELPAGMEPVAWLASYQDREGNEASYTTTHHALAVENDANGVPQALHTATQVLAMGRVPPGWQAVPVEPTREMVRAGYYQELKAAQRAEMYRAMLAAAPRPPAAQERKPLTDEQILAAATPALPGNGHSLIWETHPTYAKACGMDQDARWAVTELRPEQTIAMARAIEAAHGIKTAP